MNRSIKYAVLSDCGEYRYLLTRGECKNPLVFIMLNPSTADHEEDDPTIRRCMGFAEDNGFDGVVVLNLYAFRSTAPENLWKCENPIGDLNDFYLSNVQSEEVIFAWGKNARKDRVNQVIEIFKSKGISVKCLGVNKDNSPKHPLYLAKNSKIMNWEQSQ